jgi:hypothetical protein
MNGGAVTALYDGEGNRVAKSAGGVVTRYRVDDLSPTGYPQVVEETVNALAGGPGLPPQSGCPLPLAFGEATNPLRANSERPPHRRCRAPAPCNGLHS